MIFVITSVKWRTIPKIFKLEAYKRRHRPVSGEYLYFWFFGVIKGGGNAEFELKYEIFDQSRQLNLPIYAETSEKRNKVIYKRFGFTTYHIYEDQKENLQFWFMKWEPEA